MKGTIYKSTSKSGRISWRYQVDAGKDENGNRVRFGESGFRLEREAIDAMREAMQERKHGRAATAETFGEYLRQWLPYYTKAKPLAPKTAETYGFLMAHAAQALGAVPLKDLTTFALDDLYVTLAETFSAKTVREVHNVVHVALRRAVKTKLIPANPADSCDLPRVDQKEAVALSPDQLDAYQEAAAGTWVDLLIRLAAATGCRRGELCAARWSDFDWETGKLHIERSLYQVKGELGIKCTKGRRARTVVVPASLLEYLKLHAEAMEQNRAAFGPDYRSDLNLIFASPAGDYLLPNSVTHAAIRLAKKAGLEGVSLHSLRHTHASVLLRLGVSVVDVAARLGHRNASTTMRIYAHSIPNTDQDVAEAWDAAMSEKRQPKLRAQIGTNPAEKGSRESASYS